MSEFDVVDGGMTDRRLDDADIEALVEGRSVAGVSAQLTELLAVLRDHAETDVLVSAALNEFFVAGTPSVAHSPVNGDGATVLSLRRRRVSSLTKAASVVGLVPVSLLIGVTMAAAAALGGAHMAGLVDVPLLPGGAGRSEVDQPAPPPVLPSVASHVGALDPGTSEPREADTASNPPAAVVTKRPTSPAESVPTDRRATPMVLPDGAAVEGSPGCELGQESSKPQREPSTATTRIGTERDPQADHSIDPCERASPTVAPVPHSNDSSSAAPDHDATAPRDGGSPPARPPVVVAPVAPSSVAPSSVAPSSVTPSSVAPSSVTPTSVSPPLVTAPPTGPPSPPRAPRTP